MRNKVALFLFVIVLTFIATFSLEIFHNIFIETDSNFSTEASGAFLGAFLAFLFLRLADFFRSYSERTSKNHNALIKLQHQLNYQLNLLSDNSFIIDTFKKGYLEHNNNSSPGSVFLWTNRLYPIDQIDHLIVDLLNIDFINELFTVNIHLKKLNQSFRTANDTYTESKSALMNGNISTENHSQNTKKILDDLSRTQLFIHELMDETKCGIATTTVFLRKAPFLNTLLKQLPGHRYGRNFARHRKQEIDLLNDQISIKAISDNKCNW